MLASWRQVAEGGDKGQNTPKPCSRDLFAANPYVPPYFSPPNVKESPVLIQRLSVIKSASGSQAFST